MTTPGVSIVICCHNSALRLPATLECLALQEVPGGVSWEIILVNNGSTDATTDVARAAWADIKQIPLLVVDEPILGLSQARATGLRKASFEYVCFVDDDNLVGPDWISRVANTMHTHPEVAALGGPSVAVTQMAVPQWFHRFQIHYAVGAQSEKAGDITWTRGYLWGAGLTIRNAAWQELARLGFRSLLSDRRGTTLASGGDVELCYALRLAGWKLWYEPGLLLRHFLPENRLSWTYLRRLHRGFGAASVGHDPYLMTLNASAKSLQGKFGLIWTWQTRAAMQGLARRYRTLIAGLQYPMEGDPEVLSVERLRGRLWELLRRRQAYDESIWEISNAVWRTVPCRPYLSCTDTNPRS